MTAPDLLPCPFCGGEAEIIDAVEAGPQAYVVCCIFCLCSSKVVYALKDDVAFDLASAWNARTDLAQAMVAAAYEDAADMVANRGYQTISQEVRARTPDDAKAALERVKLEARNEALREAADVARDRHIAWHKQGEDCAVECDVTACRNIANAITTLIEKDATND